MASDNRKIEAADPILSHVRRGRPMISGVFRRWRALRPRSRAMAALLALTTFLVGFGIADSWWRDTWPARVVPRAPMTALPLAFSPDGRTFPTAGRGEITPWDVASGRRGESWPLKPGQSPVLGAFSPDGKTYASATYTLGQLLSIELFDPATGRSRATLDTPRRTIAHLSFADDGRTIRGFLGDDPQLRGCSSWNPGFGSDLSEVVARDTATGREVSSRPLAAPTRGAVTAISPDGRILALSDRLTAAVQLWDLDADGTLGTLAVPAAAGNVAGAGLGFSDDGRTLAIGRTGGTIELWDVPARRLRRTLRGHTDDFGFTTIRSSPDGRTLALTGYRWGTKSSLRKIREAIGSVLGMGPRYDAQVLLLDVATGRRLAGAADSTLPSFSPDGRALATGEPDGSTRLREVPGPR